jgi:hypothetical protein
VNDLLIDVKNSRQSKSNKKNYVEHCVPQFKKDRYQQNIIIAGILSSFLWPPFIIDPQKAPDNLDTSITFLGITNLENLTALKKHFEDSSLLEISLNRPGKGFTQFIPPWLFDYPDFLYEHRDRILNDISKISIPTYDLCKKFGFNPMPLFIAAGIDFQHHWNQWGLASWENSFLTQILDWRKKYKLSLPFLFMTILKHFLHTISHPQPVEDSYHPKGYRRFLYYPEHDDMDNDKPLFIYDPLKTIDSLISALITLWTTEHSLIRRFRIFKLQNMNILRGRFSADDEKWKTLIAYCGGRRLDNTICDKNPLILGKAQNCSDCGKLICTSCGFCEKSCPLCEANQLEVQNNLIYDSN